MKKYINRPLYLNQLISCRNDGEIKVITGSRRCGKSWLLNHLYRDWLLSEGVPEQNIIVISLDIDDDSSNEDLRDVAALKKFVYGRIVSSTEQYYVFIDEIQEIDGFERFVNGLCAKDNVDVYVTGSNSHLLSSDINTIFRGRGNEIRVYPLTFKEFSAGRTEPLRELWQEYYTYGGMPRLLSLKSQEQKIRYLKRLWDKTYIDDVIERNKVKNRMALESVVDALCSAIGCLTNPNRIQNTLQSVQHVKIDSETVNSYLGYLENAFLFEGACRYNIKGAKYYDSIKKYYAVDVGLRNARLNFRQQEPTHIMENVIYNELRTRGYMVDVGVVESREMRDGTSSLIRYEVDFIATNGLSKCYIQSAYALPTIEKREQELQSLKKIPDSFRKIIIVGDDIAPYTDNNGYAFIGIFDFLLKPELLVM